MLCLPRFVSGKNEVCIPDVCTISLLRVEKDAIECILNGVRTDNCEVSSAYKLDVRQGTHPQTGKKRRSSTIYIPETVLPVINAIQESHEVIVTVQRGQCFRILHPDIRMVFSKLRPKHQMALLGFSAPAEIPVHRRELYDVIAEEQSRQRFND